MIKNFIDYAFYGDVTDKPIEVVYKLYLIYCNLFGIENKLDNKTLQDEICKCCNVIKLKNKYVKAEY